ncbi:hypothetical protein KW801_03065 [Candidatus Saccharibacteria bacterium]|nr:hypothetical protein [Candidatus Saccharibacteria bacterium]
MSAEAPQIELVAHNNELIESDIGKKRSTSLVYGSREMLDALENLAQRRVVQVGELAVGKFTQMTIDMAPAVESLET